MSVICFCEHELGNLCAAASKATGEPVGGFIRAAVYYSVDNAACYNFTYRHNDADADPADPSTMESYLPPEPHVGRAKRTAKLLRYNLYANCGKDFISDESHAACMKLCEAMGQAVGCDRQT